MQSGLCVPTTFTDTFLDRINLINQGTGMKIQEIYGSLKTSVTGTLRPLHWLPDVDEELLGQHIQKAHSYGLKFNYILNSTCMGNKEYDLEFKEPFRLFFESLAEMNVDAVTVFNPYILSYLRKAYPKIEVIASITNEINSIRRIKQFQALGVDRVVLDKSVSRNSYLLNKLKSMSLDFEILCNSSCVGDCPYVTYHSNISSHASQLDQSGKPGTYKNFCTKLCDLQKFEDPAELIRATWIRPEDLSTYEQFGISHFKIDGRGYEESYILRVIQAYSEQKFDGNLLSLIQRRFPTNKAEFDNPPNGILPVFIDNQNLNNFLSKLLEMKRDCRNDCAECGYCDKVAQKEILINQSFIDMFKDKLKEELQEDLNFWSATD